MIFPTYDIILLIMQDYKKPLRTITSLVVIFGLFYLVYQNFYRPTSETDSWQNFTSQNDKVSIYYPKAWKVKESPNGGGSDMSSFTITNGEYSLSYAPTSTITNLCIFDDTDVTMLKRSSDESTPGYFEQASIYLTSFTQFGNFRRANYNGDTVICYLPLNMETGFKYDVPGNPDPDTIAMMDQIILRSNWGGMLTP